MIKAAHMTKFANLIDGAAQTIWNKRTKRHRHAQKTQLSAILTNNVPQLRQRLQNHATVARPVQIMNYVALEGPILSNIGTTQLALGQPGAIKCSIFTARHRKIKHIISSLLLLIIPPCASRWMLTLCLSLQKLQIQQLSRQIPK